MILRRALSLALCFAMIIGAVCFIPLESRADDSIFTSTPPTTVYEGFGYAYQVTTSETVTSWSISGGEPMISIGETGLVSSTGGGTLGASFPLSIAATTATGTYHQNYTLTVISMFTSSPVIAGQEGVGYSYQVTIHEDAVTWSMEGPEWLDINGTGMVSGTPPVGAAGEHEVTVSVWTNYGEALARSNQVYTLTVIQNADLVFTSTPPTTVYEYWGYSYQVTTSIEIDSWVIWVDEYQPAWLYINESGVVGTSGIPGEISTSYSISIAATVENVTYYQNYTLTVIGMFTSTPVTTARDDVAYSYMALSREPAVSLAVSGAEWLSIDSNGLVTGTPPVGAAGQHEITVSVWTMNGEDLARSNQVYTLEVLPNAAYAITSEPVTNATANISYEYQVTCRYAVTDWNLTGPEWLSISSAGLVTGTAPNGTDGSFNISVRATLTDGSMAWQNYTLEVERQPYTAEDGLAIAFGLLGFAMVLSALVTVMTAARRRH